MDLEDFASSIDGFTRLSHASKIQLFGWYLHTYGQKATFNASDIKDCFDRLHLMQPSSISPFLKAMVERRPQEALQDNSGYRLEATVRQRLKDLYGQRAATIQVHKLLTELPGRITSVDEQNYLEEALTCFRHKAFRAAVVMCWNLAFDHLCQHVMDKHLAAFNTQLPKSFPRADISSIAKRDDFSELKEYQVLQVCKSANIISGSVHKILKEKLERRNIAAHPSGVVTSEPTAEEYIKDLIENAVLKIT